jgi:hypothetical protein
MQLVQTNVYPEAAIVQVAPVVAVEAIQPTPVVAVIEPATAEIIDFPINKLEAERLAVQAALQQAA